MATKKVKKNVDQMLAGKKAPAKKPAKKEAATAKLDKAAKKVVSDIDAVLAGAKGGKKPSAKKAEAPKRVRKSQAANFAEGERDKLMAAVKRLKKETNSRDFATKLGIDSNKMRAVLASSARAGVVTLTMSGCRKHGYTVTPIG